MPSKFDPHVIDEQALAEVEGLSEEKERKARLKRRYMQPDLSLEDMFKQSCARAYFMKTRRNELHKPESSQWQSVPVASKYLSQFKNNKSRLEELESFFDAAVATGRGKDAEEYKAKANEKLGKCLFAHYVIGKLYTEFIEGMVIN